MHTKYKGLISPPQYSSEHLTIPQTDRTRNGPQIKESFKLSFHKAPKRLCWIKHLETQASDQSI